MPKYKNNGHKKPYNVAQSKVHNIKNKVLTLDAIKGAPLQTPQTAEAFKCSQCNDSDNGLLQCKYCDLWYCSKCCAISEKVLTIIGEFDSLHWYCQPCDVEVSKAINTGLPSNTTQDAQLAIGQQIEVLKTNYQA